MIGGPIQNKFWSIEKYLEGIWNQDYPKSLISLVFYVNDSIDGTREILLDKLREFKESGEYRRIEVIEQNWGYVDARKNRDDHLISRHSNPNKDVSNFSHFARVRNAWLDLRKDEEYYFSIDSDVYLVQSFILNQLISQEKDIIAVPVDNAQNRTDGYDPRAEALSHMLKDPKEKNREFANALRSGALGKNFVSGNIWNFGMLRGNQFLRLKKEPCLINVDLTGACILFHSKIVLQGVKYGPSLIGEDEYFCTMARTLGFKIYVDGTLETIHNMDKLDDRLKETVEVA